MCMKRIASAREAKCHRLSVKEQSLSMGVYVNDTKSVWMISPGLASARSSQPQRRCNTGAAP